MDHRISLVFLAACFAATCLGCGASNPSQPAPQDAGTLEVAGDVGRDVVPDTGLDVPPADPGEAPADVGPDTPDVPPTPGKCDEPLSAPSGRVWPAAGELYYAQLGLGGMSMGESAVVIGPDGTILLIDLGNDAHDDDVQDALAALIGYMNQAGGFPQRAPNSADHVVVTHMHADHSDGLQDLLEDISLSGRVIHRGFVDLTDAANDATIEQLCDTLTTHPGLAFPLCHGEQPAPCNPAARSGIYPSVACDGLDAGDISVEGDAGPTRVPLGSGARLEVLGVNGVMAGDSYEQLMGPLDSQDSNGENARSVVGILSHGAFRLLFAGDLTGGGSDTDAVEGFFASRLQAAGGIDALGVDVLHAGHHGRDTSSSAAWVERLLPADGLSRNVVIGISTAHFGSPHQEVLDRFFGGDRLKEGRAWTTTVATGGDSAGQLIDAEGGWIVVATIDGGDGYVVQAIAENGTVMHSRAYHSAGTCAQ